MGRVASIDYGTVRIGLAISDEQKIIAKALAPILASKKGEESAKKIADSLSTYSLEALIIGFPIHFNGKEGFLADEVRTFIDHLKKFFTCPIIPIDERLTTVQAERSLREAQLSRKKRKGKIDAVTAVILLTNYLDLLHKTA